MDERPHDLDSTRAAIAARGLVATASGYLTTDVATRLPFEALGQFKNLLKQYFSDQPWTARDEDALSAIVTPVLDDGWWEHDLGGGITLAHGVIGGEYRLWVGGSSAPTQSIFDRAFSGPVKPEATPHPRKVKFTIGGSPGPGRWFRRTDPEPPPDSRVKRLFAEPDVTDVMVAGDFVTVGISARSPWERRLEPLLALVTELFWEPGKVAGGTARTRDELIEEGLGIRVSLRPEDLHLLDPDDPASRKRLIDAQGAEDVRVRRVAVAVLAEVADDGVRRAALRRGYGDVSRIVRRTAIDAAAGTEDGHLRDLFEAALGDEDAWTRWKAVRALSEIGLGPSAEAVAALTDDEDFQVRFEVARVLRPASP